MKSIPVPAGPMPAIILFVVLVFGASMTLVNTGCSTAPSSRVVQVQTLKAVGHTAESAVATAAQLYKDGLITGAQANEVRALYDSRFQPLFRVAVTAAVSDLDIASPELVSLASQLASLVLQFQTSKQ